ncbi:MAG: UDP-glucose/GDP-mannose dehydrogenase family protein [Candidatus Komeilibacteria bacterium]|jgi:UDPglucose 6-dehydrogenase|nr:UDP-glucose/GDP-mannose dehydrogenase family protein [Candidatus Komeilibacteria bacterium]MBT4447189.1 UDP-glucose/GDP-mannose dehydrogenase family protein [Candidatus Komeilibacteria bacterium]
MSKNLKIGFIGQGFIGKNYADDFEARGYNIVRYDINGYEAGKDKIKDCDIVLIAVPTPTTVNGFNDSIVQEVLSLIGENKIAVIKSTLQVGTTVKMQKLFPNITVMHSPEFLREKYAADDAKHPNRNIVGITDINNKKLKEKAELVMTTLAKAPYELITQVANAEMIKYGGNCLLYFRVVFMNMMYDLAGKYNLDHKIIKEAMSKDPRIGDSHLKVMHKGGRGAAGHCFIKDFEAFIEMLSSQNLDEQKKAAEAVRDLNVKYMRDSNKDLDLLKDIYGK